MVGGYDIGYHACGCFWGTEPSSLIIKLARIIDSFVGLSVLDAGCGEGKNALFLAEKGANVAAFDVSEAAISNARGFAAARGITGIDYRVADVRISDLRESFDVIIAYGLLHCMKNIAQVLSVCRNLQSATRPGGYFALCAFNSRKQDLRAHPGFLPILIDHGLYVDLFRGWELLECTDADLTETHPNNEIEHTHSMTRILARKPFEDTRVAEGELHAERDK
jgi:cyclopropane fatty-acyl-phospholipid synthase-like methyltransferase